MTGCALTVCFLVLELLLPAARADQTASAAAVDGWVNLAGQWRFALDPNNAGLKEEWFQKSLDDTIQLPGTTDENRKGTPSNDHETTHLTRLYPFVGSAWYQRDIVVPPDWSHKRVSLFLDAPRTADFGLTAIASIHKIRSWFPTSICSMLFCRVAIS